ncbi:MAG TPA: hypothetical protein DDZ08_03230, partial [Cobetia sp.]|nr:hypothetical protein [Cobetia sp.]
LETPPQASQALAQLALITAQGAFKASREGFKTRMFGRCGSGVAQGLPLLNQRPHATRAAGNSREFSLTLACTRQQAMTPE